MKSGHSLKRTIFLDTVVFMEHEPFTTIPWGRLAETKRYELRVPMVVIRELDQHKDNPKGSQRRRDRSRSALKSLVPVGGVAAAAVVEHQEAHLWDWPLRAAIEAVALSHAF